MLAPPAAHPCAEALGQAACSQTRQTSLVGLLKECGDQLPEVLGDSIRAFLGQPKSDTAAPQTTAPATRGRKGKAAASTPAQGASTRQRRTAAGEQAKLTSASRAATNASSP